MSLSMRMGMLRGDADVACPADDVPDLVDNFEATA